MQKKREKKGKMDLVIACKRQSKRLRFIGKMADVEQLEPWILVKLVREAADSLDALQIDIATSDLPLHPTDTH